MSISNPIYLAVWPDPAEIRREHTLGKEGTSDEVLMTDYISQSNVDERNAPSRLNQFVIHKRKKNQRFEFERA